MKEKSIYLVCLLSVASLCSALGATTTKRNVQFKSDLALSLLCDVVYDVEETGAKIITPKTVPKPEPPSLPFLNQGSFLGYYGKFHTSDSGEEEVELKVYDENGNTVGFLPGVVLPPAPDEFYAKWAPTEEPKPPKEDTWDGTEPILYFIESFMPGNSNEKIADYTDRISKDSENYEAYIGRGFTWLTSLSESNATLLVMEKFGFGFDDRNGMISRIPALSNFDFGEKLQNEPKIDEACAIAIPALKNAIADFAMVPEDWAGAMDFTYQPDMKHPADVTVSFGYADTLLARALCCEMISALYLMKGYNTVCADGTTKKDIDLGALKEAQRWMRSAAEMVNAFVPAEANRPDTSRNYFFNLRIPADDFLRQNAQNLLDVPYWTVRFDFSLLPNLLFLNGEETALKREKRIALLDYGKFDMTLRNVFEGKLSREAGTFPVLTRGFQNLDESVTDPTFAGTFPGMSRTALAGFLWPLEEDKVLDTLPNNPNEEIAHYGALYWIPEGAENNPDNPATFSSDLEHKIRLLNPTLEGYDFLGWTHNGVIPASEIPVGAAESLEFSARFARITPEGEEKQGTSDNPWEIGQSNAADVKAWMDDAGKLTIAGEGTGKMKDFTLIEAPWYWVRDSITALEIGSGVTILGELAFNNCRGLTSVTIPSSVGTIGERAFYGCPLSRVIAMNERPSWPLDEAFGPPSQFKGVVLVPASAVDKYKAAFGWDNYADFIRGMALVTLPPTVGYVVRDLSSEGAEIAPTEAGGTTYALPIGARVSIDVVVPGPGYVVTGDRPYVIDCVESGMVLNESLLPQVEGPPEGGKGNPWKIGATTNDTVVAWTNGTTLVVEGRGAMKGFETVAPWGTGIAEVDFGAQVTNFGANAFAGCTLETLTMRGNPPALGGNDLSDMTKIVIREDALQKFKADPDWNAYVAKFESMPVCYDYENVKTLAPFLHEVRFSDYTFDEKGETLGGVEMFSCSSVRNGNFIGRNFDFFLDDKPEFVVHVAANPEKGRLASVGMAMHTGMREDGVTNGQYTASYDLVPNRMLDGINEKSVAINQNVVAYDPEVVSGAGKEFTGTNPGAPDLNISFVTRMVLDQATNAAHAVELIKERNLVGMSVSGDTLHYMISDPKETYVVEIITNTVVARHFTMMTNFAINWDNEHARVLTDADEDVWTKDHYPEPSNLVVSAGGFVAATNALAKYYARHAEGVERFVRLRDNYDEGATFEGMEALMRRAQYSQSSTFGTQPYWYSDRCSVEVDKKLAEAGYPAAANTYMLYGLKYYKDEADPGDLLEGSLDNFLEENFMANERDCLEHKDDHRKDNCGVWQTVHNTTYDISNRMFRIAVQEDYEHTFDVFLVDRQGTKDDPWLVGKEGLDSVKAYVDEYGTLIVEGHGTMRDFYETAPAPWGTGIGKAQFGPQVMGIGANAFKGCTLESLTMLGNPPAIGDGNDLSDVTKIVIREDALQKFKADPDWSTHAEKFESVPVCYDYENVRTLAPFLHEVRFKDEYDSPVDRPYAVEPEILPAFSCTAVRNGNFYGRNFDYYLSDIPSFVVRMPARHDPDPKRNRLASIGVAAQDPMREDGVTNGQYTASYDTLPEVMHDGINECGVIMNVNVVPRCDCGELTGTNPGADDLHIAYLIRYVLDHATNATHAIELANSRNLVGNGGPDYLLHWMVADPEETYVVEIVTNKVVARHMDIISNFNWNWDNENGCPVDDAYAATHEGWGRDDYPVPYSNDVSLATINRYYTPHSDGLERFCVVREHYDEGATFDGMSNLLRRVQYTRMADTNNWPIWLSDFTVNPEMSIPKDVTNRYDRYRSNDPELVAFLTNKMSRSQDVFAHKEECRKMGLDEWQTVHNTTYDIENRMFRIAVQEDYAHTFDIYLVESVPVTPGEPIVCDTAEEASNVLKKAVFTPSADVAEKLGEDALKTYRNMFTFAVTGTGDGKWAVEAFLLPPEWTNVVESAQEATLQLPIADIAAWQSGDAPIPVQLTNCVPGFYYSLYDGAAVTELTADFRKENCNVLCGTEKTVDLPVVTPPPVCTTSGFFFVGVLEAPLPFIPGSTDSRTNRYTGPKKPVRQH